MLYLDHMKTYVLIFLLLSGDCIAQQTSIINIDSSKGARVQVKQHSGKDSQASDVRLRHGDSNFVDIDQVGNQKNQSETNGTFWTWVSNVNTVLGIAGGLIVIFGFIFTLRKKRRK